MEETHKYPFEEDLEKSRQADQELIDKLFPVAVHVSEVLANSPGVDVRLCYHSGTVRTVLITKEAKSVEEATPLLRALGTEGWHQASEPKDDETIQCRTWKLEHADFPGVTVTMRLFFWSKGAKCTFKKVGVKEKPVYELVCEEG